ncbi:hypothetical protein IV203_032692 [Nitzschia inconspicua]|uniref:DUF6824 domain-containing protein n=1 Tax=Nitzschia inconspicua TaxID=303405 RepID=A0A9K3PFN4_9STRA|nr:hypothetical protein IV203_032692 [Nitzschia inconspicua]
MFHSTEQELSCHEESVAPDSIDALLSQELNRMSFQEREVICEEIHGVHSMAVTETPDFVQEKLEELEQALERIPNHEKHVYLHALKRKSPFVADAVQLRLPMLRAEVFDAHKAAVRMVKYLDLVTDLYGSEALMRPITLSDFQPEDAQLMRLGLFQMLGGRDRTGRRIMGNFADIPANFTIRSRIKNALYMYTCLAEDEETQKKGCVFIVFHPSPGSQVCSSSKERSFVRRLMESIPIRVSAIHICLHDDALSQVIKAVALLALGPEGRARTRVHTGSKTECQYSLQSFGIPAHQIPVNLNLGQLKIKAHQRWIDLRRMKETSVRRGTTFNGIECPELNDLLFGRGRPIMRHPGNVLFRNILNSRYQEYNAAPTRKEKTEIAWSIVRQLQQSKCRFLKEADGYWVEVTSDVARQKVSVGFRDIRKTVICEFGLHRPNPSGPVGIKRDLNSSTSAFLGMDDAVKRQRCNFGFAT